ncbi:MAG: hypothetical protein EOP62_04575 [Sphingomonadales bacterium]|nr:MAG: hypothetical protein EOP62_04575 [Sphingomonadales bacterium]
MHLSLSADQELLRDGIARLLANYTPASGHDRADWRALWRALAEGGWLAVAAPEASGGMELGADSIGLLALELGRAAASAPFVEAAVTSISLIAALATPNRREEWLPAIIAGEMLTVPLLEQTIASGPGAPLADVRKVDGGWRVSGAPVLVRWGDVADSFLVPVTCEGGRLALARVGRDAGGVAINPYPTIETAQSCRLQLSDVFVGEDDLVDRGDVGVAWAMARDRAIGFACNDAVGGMERLLQLTAQYLETREQFGRKLSANQALEHRVARMAIATEEARGIALYAVLAGDEDGAVLHAAAGAAKARIGTAARFVAHNAVQLHGGMGVSEETVVHLFFKRLMAFENWLGTTTQYAEEVAERLRATRGSQSVIDLVNRAQVAA